MEIEHESEKIIKKALLDVLKKNLNLKDYRVFFFGSRVTGKNSERSDIDLGIEGRQKIPNGKMTKIKSEIEDLPFLYSIDIVDFKMVSKDFREVALKDIKIIN